MEIVEETRGVSENHSGDYKARKALEAVSYLIQYLYDEETLCDNTQWVDSKGYAMSCNLGLFYQWLTNLRNLLENRLRKGVPKYYEFLKDK